jgi:hypothetical protein
MPSPTGRGPSPGRSRGPGRMIDRSADPHRPADREGSVQCVGQPRGGGAEPGERLPAPGRVRADREPRPAAPRPAPNPRSAVELGHRRAATRGPRPRARTRRRQGKRRWTFRETVTDVAAEGRGGTSRRLCRRDRPAPLRHIDADGSFCQRPNSFPEGSVQCANQPIEGTGILSPASPPSSRTLPAPASRSSTSK